MYNRILITGATGFVGKNLSNYLKNHLPKTTDIIGIGSNTCNLLNENDTINFIQYVNPDCIIHLAAICGGIGANRKEPARFMLDNLNIGLNVIKASLATSNLKCLINTSTVCSYPKITQIPFKEEDIWKGYPEETNAPYGIAKKALVELLLACNKQYDFRSVNLIPSNMFGKWEHFNTTTSHVIPSIIRKVYDAMAKGEDKIYLWGDGSPTRDFLYVDDFCYAVTLALNTYPGPEPINIGSGRECSIKYIVNEICEQMGFDGQLVWDANLPNGQPRRRVDIMRAWELLQYKPQTTLEDGLKLTIEWFLKYVNNNNINI